MDNAAKLLKNTLLIASGSIILRLCALFFQAYLAAQAGAGQLGFYGIISSVGVVFATIAISGVRFAVTRLASQQCSLGNSYPHSLMRCAFFYGLMFGVLSGGVMYFASDALSRYWVMETSAAMPLRIISASMPFISIGAVIEGYFTAKQKVLRLVMSGISSQLIRICFVVICFASFDKENVMGILSAGSFAGEVSLSLILLILYFFESFGKKEKCKSRKNLSALAKTALPLAVSAYMRTGLSSLGQIIIPKGLRKSGMGADAAFVTYGIIGQMAFPVIMFPAALLNALGDILVPRLTGAQTNGKKIGIAHIVNRALRIGIIFSFGVMGLMFFYSDSLGECFYKSAEAGKYIRIFAPLIPIIYIDCVTDGCLKGLGQQVHSMVYNVLEGIINVTLLFLLLPTMAIRGYIAVMYIKEVFNAVLSIRRLSTVTCVDKNIAVFISVTAAAYLSYLFSGIVAPLAHLWTAISLYALFYIILLYVLNTVTREDLKWIVSLFRLNEEKTKKSAYRC